MHRSIHKCVVLKFGVPRGFARSAVRRSGAEGASRRWCTLTMGGMTGNRDPGGGMEPGIQDGRSVDRTLSE